MEAQIDDTVLTIQQVADKTGLSEYTLRYYARIGLIESVDRAENGHRRYTEMDIGWIDFLKCLRATSMPVAQMKEYADLTRVGGHTIEAWLELLRQYRSAVVSQIEELKRYLGVVDYKIDYYSQEKERKAS